MPTVLISSNNFNGQIGDIVFYPLTGGIVNIGPQLIPYYYTADYIYGTYEVYFEGYGLGCNFTLTPDTPTPTPTKTSTQTPTQTQTPTKTSTQTPTQTKTPTQTQTQTKTPTQTQTQTKTPTKTSTSTPTPTPNVSPSPTPTKTSTSTPTPTPNVSPSPTPTQTSTSTKTPTPTKTSTPTPTSPTVYDPQNAYFTSCCPTEFLFQIYDIPISVFSGFTNGDVYYIQSTNFTGCATFDSTFVVLPNNYQYSISDTFTLESDCGTCINDNSVDCNICLSPCFSIYKTGIYNPSFQPNSDLFIRIFAVDAPSLTTIELPIPDNAYAFGYAAYDIAMSSSKIWVIQRIYDVLPAKLIINEINYTSCPFVATFSKRFYYGSIGQERGFASFDEGGVSKLVIVANNQWFPNQVFEITPSSIPNLGDATSSAVLRFSYIAGFTNANNPYGSSDNPCNPNRGTYTYDFIVTDTTPRKFIAVLGCSTQRPVEEQKRVVVQYDYYTGVIETLVDITSFLPISGVNPILEPAEGLFYEDGFYYVISYTGRVIQIEASNPSNISYVGDVNTYFVNPLQYFPPDAASVYSCVTETFNLSTPTPTPTPTNTPTKTQTPTNTQTKTQTPTNTTTPTTTSTQTPTNTSTKTPTPTPTQNSTPTPTPTQTTTQTQTSTKTSTPTQTPTQTSTQTQTPTQTSTKTSTPTNTSTKTQTPTPTRTQDISPTPTPTQTQTSTQTPTQTNTKTPTQSQTPTKTQTPTQTSTPTPTPTNPYVPPVVPECFVLVNSASNLYYYNHAANTLYNVVITGFFNSEDIAHYWNPATSSGKFWMYGGFGSGSQFFREWDITSLTPLTFGPYRDVSFPSGVIFMGKGLFAVNSNTLICSETKRVPLGTPDRMIRITINAAPNNTSTFTPLFNLAGSVLTPNTVTGDILVSTNNKLIYTESNPGSPSYYYINQYDYLTNTKEFPEIQIGCGGCPSIPSPNITDANAIYQISGQFYFIDQSTGNVFNLNASPPYSATTTQNIGVIGIKGASQSSQCIGTSFTGTAPYFQFKNIQGVNPSGSYLYYVNSTFNAGIHQFLRSWGDGTVSSFGPTNLAGAVSSNYSYSNGSFTATFSNFQRNGVFDTTSLSTMKFAWISEIIPNQWTFSTWPNITQLWFNYCRIPGLSGITANPNFQRIYLFNNTNSLCEFNTFNLDNFTKLDTVSAWSNDFTGFTHNFSNVTTNSFVFDLRNNSELTNFSLIPPSGLTTFKLYGPNTECKLKFANFPNGFTACTKTINEFFVSNNSLTAWTVNLPINVINVDFSSNRQDTGVCQFGLSSFTINLTSNTGMTSLNLSNNHLTSITNTIIACTSLLTLNLAYNDLLSVPTLPNSITNLNLLANDLVGMSSLPPSLPTGLTAFNAGSISGPCGGINTFTTWNLTLTSCPNLQSFSLDGVSLTSWTTQFPTSIKILSMSNNQLTTFNFNYLAGSTNFTVSLNINQISSLSNLSTAAGLINLNLSTNQLTNQYNIIPLGSNFPSSLTALTLSFNQLTTWSTSFSGAPNLKTLVMQNCNLTQSSVDYIICDLTGTSVVGGTLTLSNDPAKPNFNSPPSALGLSCKSILTGGTKLWNVTNA